jgi:hypothetical protein
VREKVITVVAILLAIVGWWGVVLLTGQVRPSQPGAQPFFFALLFLALTGTLTPLISFLNRRFAPQSIRQDPLRFLRQSAWAALCLSAWVWLQMHRAFNLGFALVIALMFVAIEVLLSRTRSAA